MNKRVKIPKSIITGINTNYKKSQDSAGDAIKYAIKVGEGLIKSKEKLDYGEWEKWVKSALQGRISSERQCVKYMKLARNKHLALAKNAGSINETLKAIANATPEEIEEAKRLTIDLQTTKDKSIANQMSSESKEWYTPDDILERVFQVMGDIDLDPCSDPNGNVSASTCFTEQDDGLSHAWAGRVFMNPPYCGDALAWCDKLVSENPEQSITLVASNTDTQYFHKMLSYCDAVCFIKGRLEFKPGNGSSGGRSTVRNVLFYKGVNVDCFREQFEPIGSIISW